MSIGSEREEARHRLVDECGSGDEDVVHLGEQVFAGGVGVVTLEDVAFEDVELGGVGHGGGREGEVADDGNALAGDEGRVGVEGARPVVFLAGAESVGEGTYGVRVIGVDSCHADAGVFEVPGLGEGCDVAQGAADEVCGVLGGAIAGVAATWVLVRMARPRSGVTEAAQNRRQALAALGMIAGIVALNALVFRLLVEVYGA